MGAQRGGRSTGGIVEGFLKKWLSFANGSPLANLVFEVGSGNLILYLF